MTGVYRISSISKPNCIYIGSAINIEKRWNRHKHSLRNNTHHSIKLQRHYNKYGDNDLLYSLLEECLNDKLLELEQHYIDLYKPYFNCCCVAGSPLGCKRSDTTKEKIRKNALGKKYLLGCKLTEEHKRKIGEKIRGNRHTNETKLKMSMSHKGKKLSEEHKLKISASLSGANNANYGKPLSDEIKLKVSKTKLSRRKTSVKIKETTMSASFAISPNCCQCFYSFIQGDTNVIKFKFASRLDIYVTVSPSDFSVTLSGGNPTVTQVTLSGDQFNDYELWITVNRTIAAGETGTITYTANGTVEYLKDKQGNNVETFTIPITNLLT